ADRRKTCRVPEANTAQQKFARRPSTPHPPRDLWSFMRACAPDAQEALMPAHTLTPALTLDRVSFAWPDGTVALSQLSGAFGAGRTGLVGRNGSGKTTLLRLIAG